jgi:DNA-binding PadR family transcriptional regulator
VLPCSTAGFITESTEILREKVSGKLPNDNLFAIVDEMGKREYLGEFELTVMLALLRVGEDAYGVPVAREIEESSGREVGIASVYAALERLERKGFVSSQMGEPTPERGGRAKRFFHVTGLGLRQVRKTHKTLVRLWQGLPQLDGGPS